MLVWEPERVAGLVANNAVVLRLWRGHRETFQVHRRLIFRNRLNIGPEVGPIPIRRLGNPYIAARRDNGEVRVAVLGPRIHVRQDPLLEIGRSVV
jgi:hypothetical protein